MGHRFWRDWSAGLAVVERLAGGPLPACVELEAFDYGAIAVMQHLEDRRGRYHRCVFVAAEQRGRPRGRSYAYRWTGGAVEPALVQRLITEAGAGVVALDPVLAICGHFRVLPRDVRVVEIEPVDTSWGEGLSPELQAVLPRIAEEVLEQALVPGDRGAPALRGGRRRGGN